MNIEVLDFRIALYNTMKKDAYFKALGYRCERLDVYRHHITTLQILSFKGALFESKLHKMAGGARLTMNKALKVLLENGYITQSMKPILHKTPAGNFFIERKVYHIAPPARAALKRLSEYLNDKLKEVQANSTNKRLILP